MLTGKGNRAVDEEALKAGAADYLPKTQVNADLLERSIRYARERKRVERALQEAREELETRVQERTIELRQANAALRAEMAERERAEQKLRESERLATIGTTAAKLAHEIGNPLNGMATTIQLLERHLTKHQETTDDVQIEIVHDLKHETHRLQSLLQELRALAHPHHLDFQRTDLTTLVAEVLRLQESHYTECGIRIEQSFPVTLPSPLADKEKLSQALLNLCKNAAEAMPTGGTLTVCGSSLKGQVCLEIGDTGEGVPEGINIFEPFTTTKTDGTGLGLAIVQQIVAAHRGTITYTSKPGQGTTFTLQLPAAPLNESR
jgi:signal transduction histidine kinase